MQRVWPIIVAVSLAALAWTVVDNMRLREQLRSKAAAAAPPSTETDEQPAADSASQTGDSAARRPGLFSRFAPGARKRPSLPEEKRETRSERRKRRSFEMRELLGRREGESEEDYIARVRPFVVAGLAEPRTRLEQARADVERAANVTDEQRAKLDEVLNDVYSEAIDLANTAISDGDLDPYRRNWAGALSVAGGFGAVLQTADQRMNEILSPEQQQIFYDAGFEWGEYIGVKAPWERLQPPPPPQP